MPMLSEAEEDAHLDSGQQKEEAIGSVDWQVLLVIAAAFGLAAIIAATPALYQALRWAGVLYLLWLAWDGWRDDGAEDDDDMQVALSRLYDELLPSDQEHGDVSVVHETGWCMSAHWSCPDLADRFDCLNQLGALVSNSIGDT